MITCEMYTKKFHKSGSNVCSLQTIGMVSQTRVKPSPGLNLTLNEESSYKSQFNPGLV